VPRRASFLVLTVLFAFFGMATSTALFAQSTPQAETKPRISCGVLIDTSTHQKKVIEFQRDVVNSIAEGFAGLATESFVIRYEDEVRILRDWSPLDSRLKKVSAQIELEAESGKSGRTVLYDALNLALLGFVGGNRANSKVLIVIGEGNNAGATTKYSQIAKHAKTAHVQCFALLFAAHTSWEVA
jgi:hypothetical protein